MLALLKPIVLAFLKSEKFKLFVVDLLEKLVEQSDNELDDKALAIVKKRTRHCMKRAGEQQFNELHNLVTN